MNYPMNPSVPLYAPIVNLMLSGAVIREDTEDMLVAELDGLFIGAGKVDQSEAFRNSNMSLCLDPVPANEMYYARVFESINPVTQYVYPYDSVGLSLPDGVSIRQLTEEDTPFVCAHYHHPSATPRHIGERVKDYMLGAFVGGQCVGFAGIHEEDALGMLEVLPEFRRRGIARALVQSLTRHQLENRRIPYAHVYLHNTISDNMFRRLGFTAVSHPVCWLCKDSVYRAKKLL